MECDNSSNSSLSPKANINFYKTFWQLPTNYTQTKTDDDCFQITRIRGFSELNNN